MKSVLVQRLSLRCKFKSADTIEVAVVDHNTGDCFIHQLAFREFKEPAVIVPVDKVPADHIDQNIVVDDNECAESDELNEVNQESEGE